MPQALDKRVGEWRDADSRAREAESAVARLVFLQGEDRPPTDGLIKEAKLLRKLANEKLKLAIAAMRPEA